MLKKIKTWFIGLSRAGKVAVIGSAVVFGAAGASSQSQQAAVNNTAKPSVVQQPRVETKSATTTEEIPFTSSTIQDGALAKGSKEVRTAGVKGTKTTVWSVTYTDGKESGKKLVSQSVTTEPINEVVAEGTYVAPVVTTPPPAVSSSVYYANCTAARNAGVTPIYAGEPGYRSALDRDNDGVACE